MKTKTPDEIQADTSREVVAKINKKKVAKLKSPNTDKMFQLRINKNTTLYYKTLKKRITKLRKMKKENPKLKYKYKFGYIKIL